MVQEQTGAEYAPRRMVEREVAAPRERPPFLLRALRWIFNPRWRREPRLEQGLRRLTDAGRHEDWMALHERIFASSGSRFRGNPHTIDDALQLVDLSQAHFSDRAETVRDLAAQRLPPTLRRSLHRIADEYEALGTWVSGYAGAGNNPFKQAVLQNLAMGNQSSLVQEFGQLAGIRNNVLRIADRNDAMAAKAFMNVYASDRNAALRGVLQRLQTLHGIIDRLPPQIKGEILSKFREAVPRDSATAGGAGGHH